ncbi:hypothetical protein BCR42DRAFT_42182 [Absidia repens]|uniref:WW domain-containing protein n=1 Tax=Absidia repens TaxID=90262 RepID=A0A1X2IG10_9FUNG|nr:hypothetical protein BCR42DRAFT_42182 [Absidia repens]
MSSGGHPPPPQVPDGWLALWDETSQRYYFVNQATGVTQWDHPQAQQQDSGYPSSNYAQGTTPFPGQGTSSPYSEKQSYPPTSAPITSMPKGEAGSYASPPAYNDVMNQNPSPYTTQGSPSYNGDAKQQQQQHTEGTATAATDGEGDRGLGSMLSGFMKPQHGGGGYGTSSSSSGGKFPMNAAGGAVAGALLTMAAGKLGGKNNHGGSSSGHSSGGLLGNLMGGGHQQQVRKK